MFVKFGSRWGTIFARGDQFWQPKSVWGDQFLGGTDFGVTGLTFLQPAGSFCLGYHSVPGVRNVRLACNPGVIFVILILIQIRNLQ